MSNVVWKVDAVHSSLQFSIRHLVVAKVTGQFRRWNAELVMNETDLTASSVAITIEAASLDTNNTDRDTSLRSPRFFDVEQFPTVTFRSRCVERAAASYRIDGDLTMRGVTRPLSLDAEHGGFVTDHRGARRAGFTIRGSVPRSEFGMVFNQMLEGGGLLIGDRVELVAEVEAVASDPGVAA